MSFTFKLARRTARLRALATATMVVVGVACNADESTAPIVDAETPATPAAATPAAETLSLYTSSTAPGIPFGDFHLPTSEFDNTRYSGSLQALWTSSAYTVLNTAKSYGERVVISVAGNRGYYTNSDGTFNMTKWKARVALFKGYNFAQYVTAGTIIGHYLVDEPFCSSCWGGKKITYSEIEEMSKYSKSLWSSMPTGVRSPPSLLGSTAFSSLDFAWAQWEGPLHFPSYKLTPEQFRDQQTSKAKTLGLGLVFGLNYLDGGDGTSHINGTYAKDPNLSDNQYCSSSGSCYRYAMSASEVRKVGQVFAAASFSCGVLSWKYDTSFIGRTGMKDALDAVSYTARSRSRTSCKQ